MPEVRSVDQLPGVQRLLGRAVVPPAASATATLGCRLRQAGVPACYRSDERLLCHESACAWRRECWRLVAAWKR